MAGEDGAVTEMVLWQEDGVVTEMALRQGDGAVTGTVLRQEMWFCEKDMERGLRQSGNGGLVWGTGGKGWLI